jgi:hypothetical protein
VETLPAVTASGASPEARADPLGPSPGRCRYQSHSPPSQQSQYCLHGAPQDLSFGSRL